MDQFFENPNRMVLGNSLFCVRSNRTRPAGRRTQRLPNEKQHIAVPQGVPRETRMGRSAMANFEPKVGNKKTADEFSSINRPFPLIHALFSRSVETLEDVGVKRSIHLCFRKISAPNGRAPVFAVCLIVI